VSERRLLRRVRLGLGSPWALVLAGPVIGTAYFLVVYLLAEAGCAEHLDVLGAAALRAVIVGAAAAAIVLFGVYAMRARRLWSDAAGGDTQREQNARFMVATGVLLLGLFVLFVLFLAAPAVGTSLC
jgi:hypothetical protein